MFSRTRALVLISVILLAGISTHDGWIGSALVQDPSSIVGGLFDNDIANTLCGIGVGVLVGGAAFFSGGTLAIIATIAAPKAAAACIGAALM